MPPLLRLALLALLAPALLPASPTEPATFRVMTYNIHHGEGLDRKVDLARIAAVIREARADLVALQEVDRGVERTQRRDLPAELAQLTGFTAVFENNFHYQGGEYGNAILSRFPVRRSRNTHYRMLRPGEQRGVLQAVIDVRGREILLLNTHLDFRPGDEERLQNVDELAALVAAAGTMPVLLAGDFNATPDSRTAAKVRAFLRDTWAEVGQGPGLTIPVRQPTKRIDYLWFTPNGLQPLGADVPRSEASDHLPVVAEFRLR